ncbi:MAG: hypothetical protein J6N56_04660 [Bacteroidales bacterium]|nr:hypothetical protein [Bacteroidales bacterium]
MKIIYTRRFPFMGKDFIAINLFGMIIVRKGRFLSADSILHERIHTAQMREMLFVFFYLWYVTEWLVRMLWCFSAQKAYWRISFEREAYDNEGNPGYLKQRKLFGWMKYL